jgi:hypothetical protein
MTENREILFAIFVLLIYLVSISLLFEFWHNRNCYLNGERGAIILNEFCSDSLGLIFIFFLSIPFIVIIFAVYGKIQTEYINLNITKQ